MEPSEMCSLCSNYPCDRLTFCFSSEDEFIADPNVLLCELAEWRRNLFGKNNMLFANERNLWRSVQNYLVKEGFEFKEDIIPYEGSNPVH